MRRLDNPHTDERRPRLSPQVNYQAVVAEYIHEISSRHESADESLPASEE